MHSRLSEKVHSKRVRKLETGPLFLLIVAGIIYIVHDGVAGMTIYGAL